MGIGCMVYPRVGGGTLNRIVELLPVTGLSPRGRGNRSGGHADSYILGSIPAWAGEPVHREANKPVNGVYPRVGGGTSFCTTSDREPLGLSPRGRGNLTGASVVMMCPRSIPAWAGEPHWSECRHDVSTVYPRVGGGTTAPGTSPRAHLGLSPRGRGNPL